MYFSRGHVCTFIDNKVVNLKFAKQTFGMIFLIFIGNRRHSIQGRARSLLLRISSAHAIHDVARAMYFKRAHQVETQQNIELMTYAVT